MTDNNLPLATLLDMLKKGEIAEAHEKYFGDVVRTQEDNGPKVSGQANAKAAPAVFHAANNIPGFIAYEVGNAAVNGNYSFNDVAWVL